MTDCIATLRLWDNKYDYEVSGNRNTLRKKLGNSFFLFWLEGRGNIERGAEHGIWVQYIDIHTYEWGEFDSAEWRRDSKYQPVLASTGLYYCLYWLYWLYYWTPIQTIMEPVQYDIWYAE